MKTTWRELVLAMSLLLAATIPARADDPPKASADGMTVAAQAGVIATVTGEERKLTPAVSIDVEGPVAFGDSTPLRVRIETRLTTLPGESVDISKPETFAGATLDVALLRVVGRAQRGEQEITTSIAALAGFGTRFDGEPSPAERLVRRYGIGLRFAEARSGAGIEAYLARDETSSPAFGKGQIIVRGRVTVPATAGVAQLAGEALIDIGRDPASRDVLRLGVFADGGKLLDLVR